MRPLEIAVMSFDKYPCIFVESFHLLLQQGEMRGQGKLRKQDRYGGVVSRIVQS